jgi:hypothetical protein
MPPFGKQLRNAPPPFAVVRWRYRPLAAVELRAANGSNAAIADVAISTA